MIEPGITMKINPKETINQVSQKLKERFKYFHNSTDEKEFFLGIVSYMDSVTENKDFLELINEKIEEKRQVAQLRPRRFCAASPQ